MNLNWLKKLFASDEKEYEEDNDRGYKEEQHTTHTTTKKTPFRFPLISDEEKNETVYEYPKEEKIVETYKEEAPYSEPEYKPLYTQNLWQQRTKPTVIHRAEKKIVAEKKVVDTPVIKRSKRAFTPTEVPSPIYGFSKTVALEKEKEIVEEREQKTEPTRADMIYKPEYISPVQEVIEEVDHIVQLTEVEQSVQLIEEDQSVRKIEVEQILEVDVEQEDVQVTELEEVLQAEVPVTEVLDVIDPVHHTTILEAEKPVKENIRPFNVLMLKSDKIKMNRIDTMNKISPVTQKKIMPIENSSNQEQKQIPEQAKANVQEVETLIEKEQEEIKANYVRPSISHLLPPEMNVEDREWMEEQAFTLVDALSHFQVTGEIVQMVQGPAVTQFEITVGQGTKVSKIRNLADDLKLALAAKDIRIQAPIPGKSSIGIEIPNRKSRAVRLSEVINTDVFLHSESPFRGSFGT